MADFVIFIVVYCNSNSIMFDYTTELAGIGDQSEFTFEN